jgi:hypothetical protein
VSWCGDPNGEFDGCGLAQPLGREGDVESYCLRGVCGGGQACACQERGQEVAGLARGASFASWNQYENLPVVWMTRA